MRAPAVPRRLLFGLPALLAVLAASALAGPAAAQPASEADRLQLRALAATCANCHGTDGRPVDAAMPPLAGRPQDFIAAELRAYRAGQRPSLVMQQISRGYGDAQIDALAAYFAGLPR